MAAHRRLDRRRDDLRGHYFLFHFVDLRELSWITLHASVPTQLSSFGQRFRECFDVSVCDRVFNQVSCAQCEPSVHKLRLFLAMKVAEYIECHGYVPNGPEPDLLRPAIGFFSVTTCSDNGSGPEPRTGHKEPYRSHPRESTHNLVVPPGDLAALGPVRKRRR